MKENTLKFIEIVTEFQNLIINEHVFDEETMNNYVKQMDECFSDDYSEIVEFVKNIMSEIKEVAGDDGIAEDDVENNAFLAVFLAFAERTETDSDILLSMTDLEDEDDDDDDDDEIGLHMLTSDRYKPLY